MKTKSISLRLSEKEYEKLLSISAKTNFKISEIIRLLLFNKDIKVTSPQCINFIKEVNAIGVNLNQLARHVNIDKKIDLIILETLVEIEITLKEMLCDC